MALARKGKKGWGSEKTKKASRNLVGKKEALKQKSWDSIRVWWAPVLACGKLHIEMLGDDFPGEKAEGAPILVSKVKAALNVRFQSGSQPSVLFVDRGAAFWATSTGKITPQFKSSLREHSLRAYYRDDASGQPGQLSEVLLHETAVSWIRHRETATRPLRPWKETAEEFATRMRGICQDINSTLDVAGLCREFPSRVQALVVAEGDRINK